MNSTWKLKSLDDLVDLRNGVNFTQASSGQSLKVVGVGDFQKKEVLCDFSNTSSVVINGVIQKDDLLADNDLLFVRSNGNKALVGRCVIVKNITEPVTFSGFTIRARVKSAEIDPGFLSKLFRSSIFQRHLHWFGSGSSINNLSQDALAHFRFRLPLLKEQQEIAAIVQTWDEVIEKLTSLVELREAEYSSRARQFFAPCHPTYRKRDNSWKSFTLGKLFKERVEAGRGSDALLSITMADGVISQDAVGRRDSSTEDKSKYKLIVPGDIGYNTMRMWQGVCGLSSLRGIISPAYTVVTPVASRIHARYAFHLFKSRRMIHDFERYSQGLTSDTWNLKYPVFSEIKVFVPDIKVQSAQANYLDALKEEVAVLKRQTQALSRQKRGLMQKLLTGEWRVSHKRGAL